MVDSPPPFAGSALGSNIAALPLTAVLNGPATLLTITFDRLLQTQPVLDDTNWAVRWNNVTRTPVSASAAGLIVTIGLTAGGADAGIDRVNYAPPPADVITLDNMLPVAAFTDFPVTM